MKLTRTYLARHPGATDRALASHLGISRERARAYRLAVESAYQNAR